MANERRTFSDSAVSTTLASGINDTVESFSLTSATGWPDGSGGDFFASITSTTTGAIELIRCQSRSTTTVTVRTGGRGYGSTSPAVYAGGESVKHVLSAEYDANEANLAVSKTVGKATAAGQMLLTDAAASFVALDVKGDGKIIVGNGTTATDVAVSGDITLSNAGVVAIATGVIINTDINASAAIALSKLATDPLARANHTGTQVSTTISDFAEGVSDQVGTMVTGNTESGIAVAYQDGDNTLDFTVAADTANIVDAAVTQAKLAARTWVSLTRASNQSVTSNSVTPISWTAEVADAEGFIAVTGTTLTVPAGLGGVFVYEFLYTWGSAIANIQSNSITINGTARDSISHDNNALNCIDAGSLFLDDGDTLTFNVYQVSGGNRNVTATLKLARVWV